MTKSGGDEPITPASILEEALSEEITPDGILLEAFAPIKWRAVEHNFATGKSYPFTAINGKGRNQGEFDSLEELFKSLDAYNIVRVRDSNTYYLHYKDGPKPLSLRTDYSITVQSFRCL